ncbi:MAG TPA: glutathione S-transferase family protein [Steroidobacteraceae bacterium]|nr:glutathione S-transferase family protein [Steroidobacteraceae bacterium]
MSAATLIIGSKNYSSWSLRPWLFLRKVAFGFQEQVLHFDAADFRRQLAALSPSKRVPLLIDGDLTVWDSLAICEWAAERTGRGVPADPRIRAVMRSVSAEMHSGFQTLRETCPMNVRATFRQVRSTPGLVADIARIDAIWSDCRQRFGAGGDWLFGEFSIADAAFAPVAFRFRTYGAELDLQLGPAASQYLQHLLSDPLMREWQSAAEQEGHSLPATDAVGL